MADKKPFKDNSGVLTEFGAADTIPTSNLGTGTANASSFLRGDQTWQAVSGAGLNILSGTAVLAYPVAGLPEESSTVTTILSALITAAGIKTVLFIPAVSTDHDSLDDFAWDDVEFNIENIVDGVSFDIRSSSYPGTWGSYNVNYIIGY